MQASLVTVESSDHLALPALWFSPAKPPQSAAIWLHGNGGASSFYSVTRTNALAEALTSQGIGFLALNNRGAETIKQLKQTRGSKTRRVLAGFAHERIRDCTHDIDGAVRFLWQQGCRRIALVGHSTGANKICVYDHRTKHNRVAAYVLVGPGDDVGIYYQTLGARRFARALTHARTQITKGHGQQQVPVAISPTPISWAALYDTLDPRGDYNVFPFLEHLQGFSLTPKARRFREVKQLRRPTLTLFGEHDEYCFGDVPGCAQVLCAHAPAHVPFEVEILTDTDHGFAGAELELGQRIATWLKAIL